MAVIWVNNIWKMQYLFGCLMCPAPKVGFSE